MLSEPEIENHLVQLHQVLSAYMTGHVPLCAHTIQSDCDAEIAGCKVFFPGTEKITELRLCEQEHTVLQPDRLYKFTVDPQCRDCVAIARHRTIFSKNPLETKRKLDIITKSAKLTAAEIKKLYEDGTPPRDDL